MLRAVQSFPSNKRSSGTVVVSSRITVLVHTRIHRSIYFKTRGTRTGIVRTCKRSEIEFTRYWLFSFTHSLIYVFPFQNTLNTIYIGYKEIITCFSRDMTPFRCLIPEVSENERAFIFRVKQLEKRRMFLLCLTIKMSAPLTQ